jgi:OPT family oligopeptide transporter
VVALTFKFYAFTGVYQAMSFSQDMKLGYYMKIPRRTTFWAQFVACFLGAITQVGVLVWAIGHIDNLCQSDQSDNFTCPQGRANFSASVLWGAVGPMRLFSPGQMYSGYLHMFWIGALCPVVTWLMLKRWPNNFILRNLNWVVFFGGTNNYPPATGINYTSWFAVGALFNWWIKRRRGAWWTKYAYVTSAALDVGLALSGIVIFFALSYPGVSIDWWGNSVYKNTADGRLTPYKPLPAKGYFGPDKW